MGVVIRFIESILQQVINAIGVLGEFIGTLPTSPFQNLEKYIPENPAIDFILWIIPVQQAVAIVQLWLVAIGIYYLAKVPLRWAKVVAS